MLEIADEMVRAAPMEYCVPSTGERTYNGRGTTAPGCVRISAGTPVFATILAKAAAVGRPAGR